MDIPNMCPDVSLLPNFVFRTAIQLKKNDIIMQIKHYNFEEETSRKYFIITKMNNKSMIIRPCTQVGTIINNEEAITKKISKYTDDYIKQWKQDREDIEWTEEQWMILV